MYNIDGRPDPEVGPGSEAPCEAGGGGWHSMSRYQMSPGSKNPICETQGSYRVLNN